MADLYNLDASRSHTQVGHMMRLERDGICIFCPEHIAQEQGEIVIAGVHWMVTKNRYPYEGAREHFIISSREHVASFADLPDRAGAELWSIRRALAERFDAKATATIERSGDTDLTGASITHLHIHFIIPERHPEKTIRVRVSARGDRD